MLKQLSKTIALLAEDQTVILVVDELDRCLPEYAIKVLERLHHVFGDIPNMQVILAVDKNQLVQTISSLYGSNTSIERYLKKFIDFELSLYTGDIGNIVKELYPQYHSCFSCQTLQSDKADDLCSLILADIDIRTCKLIAEKSHLCHRILTSDNIICDSSILCVELFLTVLKQYGLKVSDAKNHFSEQNLFASNLFSPENNYALKNWALITKQKIAKLDTIITILLALLILIYVICLVLLSDVTEQSWGSIMSIGAVDMRMS